MSAAAEKLGLSAEDPDDSPHRDLDEARRLITALAGLVTASAEYLGPHAGPVRDGLKSCSWRSANPVPRPTNRATARARSTPGRSGSCLPSALACAVTTISRPERISSRPMTLTTLDPARPPRTRWVPAAAGWTVGIIATLSLIASVSPGSGGSSGFPASSSTTTSSTSLTPASRGRSCWPCWPPRWRPASASRGGSCCSTWSPRSAGTSATSSPATSRSIEDIGEVIGLAFHVAAIAVPGAGPQRVLGEGPARRAVQGRRRAASPAWRSARCIGWGLLELFPGTLAREDRLLYALNRVSAFAGADPSSSAAIRTSSSMRCSACSARWR